MSTPFSRALKQALATAGITQAELAHVAGATQSMVSTWVNGKFPPKPAAAEQIEQHLGLTPGDLSRHLGYLTMSFD